MALVTTFLVVGCGTDDADRRVVREDAFDAFDIACAMLEESAASDPAGAVDTAVAQLAESADQQAAINTIRNAVEDRCPEWRDAVDASLGAVP